MVRYTGGKVRLAPKITKHLEKDLQELNCKGVYPIYWEPFFGAGSVMASLDTGKVLLPVGSDINKGLMRLWRDDEVMPSTVSKEDYYAVKAVDKHRDFETALGAFVGILCSYGGKVWGGYASDKSGTNYADQQWRSVQELRKVFREKNVFFIGGNYRDVLKALRDTGLLKTFPLFVYADPPYAGTTGYGAMSKDFDTLQFWRDMICLSQENPCNRVYVSEYSVPEEKDIRSKVEIVEQFHTKTTLRNKGAYGDKDIRVDTLYTIRRWT